MGPSKGISKTDTSWGGVGKAVCDGVGIGGSVLVADGWGVEVLVLVEDETVVFVGVITFCAASLQLANIRLAISRSKVVILNFIVWFRSLGALVGFASRTQPGRSLKQTRQPLVRGGIHSQ